MKGTKIEQRERTKREEKRKLKKTEREHKII
jgi:hypothetical protein